VVRGPGVVARGMPGASRVDDDSEDDVVVVPCIAA
jgi:hypothetical protein